MKFPLFSGAVLSLILFTSYSAFTASGITDYKCLQAYHKAQKDKALQANRLDEILSLSAGQRIHILCELKRAVAERYTLLDLKKERLGVEMLKVLDECILSEPEQESETPIENLHFEDRVRKCLAPARDTHLKMYGLVPRPSVYTGLEAQKIDGKYYVSAVDTDLIEHLDRDRFGLPSRFLIPGTEILEVDGLPVSHWVENFVPYISGSSELYVEQQAVKAVFQRDFFYPRYNTLILKVVDAANETTVLQIPWWYTGLNLRADTREYFRQKEISSTIRSGIPQALDRLKIAKKGYSSETPLFAQNMQEFYTDSGKIGLRMGFAKFNADFACYAQLLTFDTNQWRVGARNGRQVPALTPLREFVANCKKNKKKFILDLRSNEGGAKFDQSDVLALFTEAGKRYPSHFFSARITPSVASVIQKFRAGHDIPMGEQDPFSKSFYFDALEQALQTGRRYLPALATKYIESDPQVGGYDEKTVVLVSPDCISGCDILVDLFKKSGRAKIIGTHSNGTGAGIFGDNVRHLALWEDPHEFMRVKIPNYLFGVFEAPADQAINDFEANKEMISENRPTLADIPYTTSMEDLSGEGAGWANKALEALLSETENIPLP